MRDPGSDRNANGVRKATIRDPDGNTISFFEAPPAASRH
jgi:hypothetical protein